MIIDSVSVGDKLVYCSKDSTVTVLANHQTVKQLSYSCLQDPDFYHVAKVFASYENRAFFVDNSLRNAVVQVDLGQFGYPEEIVAVVGEGRVLQLAVDQENGVLAVLVEGPNRIVVYDIRSRREVASRTLDGCMIGL